MRPIIFLAPADAMKPVILIDAFYDSINRDSCQDFLLTNGEGGKTIDMAKRRQIRIISTEDSRFTSKEWIDNTFRDLQRGVLVSCGWPYKIPDELINKFHASVNCHGSYLPDYRGSRSYMHYWANCSEFYGASIHYLTEDFDDGNILVRGKLKCFPDESHDQIFIRTAELCGHLLVSALEMVETGNPGFRVKEKPVRYFFKRTPEEFETHHAVNIERIQNNQPPVLTPHKLLD